MVIELRKYGLVADSETPVTVFYDGEDVGNFRADLIVRRVVVIEIKATSRLRDSDREQLFNYLKATSIETGLLLHFGPKPKIRRAECLNRNKKLILTYDEVLGRP